MPPAPNVTRTVPHRTKHWELMLPNESAARLIASKYQLHPVVARILATRGWMDDAPLKQFLDPRLMDLRSPFELQDMENAVARVLLALEKHERICVYGDYDVDGVTSTALMAGTLRFLGSDPLIVIPHRIQDGYGMTLARVEEIARAGVTLIITVDNGASATEQIRRARELGMDVIVTDHHLASSETPEFHSNINPNRADAFYEHTRLCGVGVAFKFCHALLKSSKKSEAECRAFLAAQLDLVALGTIADIVPLIGENRVFVRHGLEAIRNTKRPGLRALMEVAGFKERVIQPHAVGFGLGPRLNAAGRTTDAMIALELLLTNDESTATRIARQLDELNRDRQEIEKQILEASIEELESPKASIQPNFIVVGGEGWHLGVVGIVASRLTERYGLPAIVLAIEEESAKGSARSVPGFDLHDALTACAAHLDSYGGHSAAAGLRLKRKAVPAFRDAINQHAQEVFATLDRAVKLPVDAELKPQEFSWDFFDQLQRLQPFGEGNPQPHLMMRGLTQSAPSRIVGNNHLKASLTAGGFQFDAIGFNLGHLKPVFESGAVDVVFKAMENTFNGKTKLEMELVDGRPTGH